MRRLFHPKSYRRHSQLSRVSSMEVERAPPLPERQNSAKEPSYGGGSVGGGGGRPASRKHSMRLDGGDILVCDICLEAYDEQTRTAKFLTCHHSFCEVCLRRVAAAAAGTTTTTAAGDALLSIECPTCRRVTPLTAQGVAGLQTNFYINSMKETMVRMAGRTGGGGTGCRKHFDQPLSFFCRRCEEMICRDCTVLEHRERDGHDIEDVATAAAGQRRTLATAAGDARAALDAAQAATVRLDGELTALGRARDAAVATADAAFARHAAALDARRTLVTDRVTALHAERSAGVTRRRDELAAAAAQLALAVQQGESLACDGALLEVVGTVTALRACIKQLTLQDDGTDDAPAHWIAVKVDAGADDFHRALAGLAVVVADAALPVRVTFHVVHPAIASLPAVVDVHVLDGDGQRIAAADAIVVDVVDRYDGAIAAAIRESGTDTTVHFTPQVSGDHRLTASFLGQPIEGATCVVAVASNNPVVTFGQRGSGEGNFRCPRAIAIGDDQCIFVADTGNRLIQKLDADGKFLAQFRIGMASSATGSSGGSSSAGSSSGGVITRPAHQSPPPGGSTRAGSSAGSAGSAGSAAKPSNRGVSEKTYPRSVGSAAGGATVATPPSTPAPTGYSTCDLALNRSRRVIICTETAVSESMNPTTGNTVATYSLDGCLRHRFANRLMRCALCVATNSRGDIIVSDFLVHSLFMYDRHGTLLRRVGEAGAFNHPAFICVAAADTIVVSDTNNNTIQVFDAYGVYRYQFGRPGRGKGELCQPFGVAVDGERILVADSGNARIQVFTLAGEFVSMIESAAAPLQQPRGIAVTGDGHVLVADRDNHCVKKYRYR